MPSNCEPATRTGLRAFRVEERDLVLVVAEGTLPTPGYDVDIEHSPLRIFPPQFVLRRCARPGIWPQVVTPFTYAETVRYPADEAVIGIHHADGRDDVVITGIGPELREYVRAVKGEPERSCPEGSDEATGFSRELSFDQAFRNALANLPVFEPSHPDTLERVEVLEVGALFGGFAGFHDMFVRICRTHD